MPKSRRLPLPDEEPLLDEIRATIAEHQALEQRRRHLVLTANRLGMSVSTLALVLGEAEGTLFSWIRKARAEESADEA